MGRLHIDPRIKSENDKTISKNYQLQTEIIPAQLASQMARRHAWIQLD